MSIRSLLHCAEWPRLHACVVPPSHLNGVVMKFLNRCLLLLTAVTLLAFSNTAFAQRGLERALEAQRVHNPNFFQVDGVVATGISVDKAGNAVIKVYTANAGTKVPAFANGVAVKKFVAGPITAWDRPVDQMKKPGRGGGGGGGGGDTGGTNPQTRLVRPVAIGASIGTYRPSAANACFAGTLGCRLKGSNGQRYILSNNHVMAEENAGSVGNDLIIQPGTLDNGCVLDLNDVIGSLSGFEPIKFNGQANFIDAAVAETTIADTGFASPTEAYGAPSSNTQSAYVGMPVQKFGRTTSLTRGEVDSINVTVNVGYTAGTALFENQIIIIGKRQRGRKLVDATFSEGGDSGSLIVTQGDNDPVGLLFAGNSSVTIANPINEVLTTLSALNGTMLMVDDGN